VDITISWDLTGLVVASQATRYEKTQNGSGCEGLTGVTLYDAGQIIDHTFEVGPANVVRGRLEFIGGRMGGRLDSIRGGVGGTGYLVGARMKTGCGVVEYARGRLTELSIESAARRPKSATFSFTSAAVSESFMRAAVAIPGVSD
jgi:hypothetical protein